MAFLDERDEMKVYDLEGKEHDKEGVDVRECCNMLGWSVIPPESTDEQTPPESADEQTPQNKKKHASHQK